MSGNRRDRKWRRVGRAAGVIAAGLRPWLAWINRSALYCARPGQTLHL
ncbi:MAG TPA: hypothetical protein VM534_03545 [Thermoanaerobaculia bacterium]|nr:hypothetical protein [Thermoanaerobaculia bacterium]